MNKFEKELKKLNFVYDDGIYTLDLYDDIKALSYKESGLEITYNTESDTLSLNAKSMEKGFQAFQLIKITTPKQLRNLINAIRGYF